MPANNEMGKNKFNMGFESDYKHLITKHFKNE